MIAQVDPRGAGIGCRPYAPPNAGPKIRHFQRSVKENSIIIARETP